ncbi:hypothetical protein KSZ07_19090 [Bacteroides fragilis]|uniref:fimbrillin family protein n=1 Tax=Bacteroides fragilis TaxID=817 RepID=UPI001C3831AC|nr:fimbrillin family protein [Bacteroides fragilis]MBV4192350.1 hypothetical protein [Bacteroides fragilis]
MMKTKLSVAAMAFLLAGCSSNDTDSLPENPVNATPIRVSQSVQGLATSRAVAAEGAEVTATVLMHDGTSGNWSGFTPVTKNDVADNGTLNARATVSNTTFTVGGSAADLGLNPTLYYHASNTSENSFLAAVSPAGEVNATTVKILQTDGQQDVMYAKEVAAGNSGASQTAALVFEHLTTQLNFAMKLEPIAESKGEWAGKTVSLKSIEVQEAYRPTMVNATNGDVTWDNINSGTLPVPGISNNVLSAEAVKVGTPVMIRPAAKLTVCAIINVGGTDIPFHNVPVKAAGGDDLATVKGEAHLITLTVKEPKGANATKVTATATVTPWKAGAAGSATLE